MNITTMTNKFGLIVLIIIFLIIYSYFSTNKLTNDILPPENYTEDEIIIGSLGGYHILNDISFQDKALHYRISLHTNLNRSTTLDEIIITPYTIIKQIISNDEEYQIKITLSDTQTFDLSREPITEIFKNEKMIINQGPIIEINTLKPVDNSIINIFISLNKKVKFKVDKDNTGTIFVDILK